jgi:hypothetical protein
MAGGSLALALVASLGLQHPSALRAPSLWPCTAQYCRGTRSAPPNAQNRLGPGSGPTITAARLRARRSGPLTMLREEYDLVILGGGPVGATAATNSSQRAKKHSKGTRRAPSRSLERPVSPQTLPRL